MKIAMLSLIAPAAAFVSNGRSAATRYAARSFSNTSSLFANPKGKYLQKKSLLVFDGSDMFSSYLYREEEKDTSHVYNFHVNFISPILVCHMIHLIISYHNSYYTL